MNFLKLGRNIGYINAFICFCKTISLSQITLKSFISFFKFNKKNKQNEDMNILKNGSFFQKRMVGEKLKLNEREIESQIEKIKPEFEIELLKFFYRCLKQKGELIEKNSKYIFFEIQNIRFYVNELDLITYMNGSEFETRDFKIFYSKTKNCLSIKMKYKKEKL